MLSEGKTLETQRNFAKYCRDGVMVDIGADRPDRLHHYRRLVYNVVYGIVEQAFPITRSLLNEKDFGNLVAIFLSEHNSSSSQVWQLPGEFFQFYKEKPGIWINEMPFLVDLIHMEWMEILVYNREDAEVPKHKAVKAGRNEIISINPDFELIELDYPVHKGDWNNILSRRSKYHLLIFRNIVNKKVYYFELAPVHVFFLDLLLEGERLGAAIEIISMRFSIDESDVEEKLSSFIENLNTRGFVLGVVPND